MTYLEELARETNMANLNNKKKSFQFPSITVTINNFVLGLGEFENATDYVISTLKVLNKHHAINEHEKGGILRLFPNITGFCIPPPTKETAKV